MEKGDVRNKKTACVVLGGSAGSLKAIIALLPELKPRLPFPIIIVVHRKNDQRSTLERLLAVHCSLPVKEAEDKELLLPGIIYLAPPDYHLLIENNRSLSLDCSEKVLYSRPSIDVTFQSASEVFGSSLTGILLSGGNNDGAEGLRQIKQRGGITIIQDPVSAEIPAMPVAALRLFEPDLVLDPVQIADWINHFGRS
jgi:two-component system chemotaxis response regulator CheB